ncbi:tail fiber assembly protein [Enterobacter cancerogenus]|uniref:tail fiber assembly protein n=1 Tax=Enterobacter cancerogenus TaxID=69218 RepID=UPI001299BE35|nr:tail fiber assembly protein [Enterobacter cancerogenus]QGG09285.1 tail fiber assembly protein [Enterobacter cancerogenus]
MNYYFSNSELGFYCDEVNEAIPTDAVEINEDVYLSLLEGQSKGKFISADSAGTPILTDPPEPTQVELVAQAEDKRTALMEEANASITPLQDASDLDIATDEEMESLRAWKRYRVLLNRVDTSKVPDIEWPDKPE